MARNRDPFALALQSLRQRAAQGAFHPERPVVIQDEARRLSLSTTPVREALAWLCGQGLVQRAASGGYLGARLDVEGLRHRYRFRLHCLRLGLDAASALPTSRATEPAEEAPAARLMFQRLIQRSGDDVLKAAFERIEMQLAMLAPSEARLLDGLESEAEDLAEHVAQGDAPSLLQSLSAYHRRRIDLAVPLLIDVERRTASEASAAGEASGR